jgi:ankyrin repeat protein
VRDAYFSAVLAAVRHARQGQIADVEHAMAAGLPLTAQDAVGHTMLHVAAQNGHEHLVQSLLELHADPSPFSHAGMTPLDFATQFQYHKAPGYISILEQQYHGHLILHA